MEIDSNFLFGLLRSAPISWNFHYILEDIASQNKCMPYCQDYESVKQSNSASIFLTLLLTNDGVNLATTFSVNNGFKYTTMAL